VFPNVAEFSASDCHVGRCSFLGGNGVSKFPTRDCIFAVVAV